MSQLDPIFGIHAEALQVQQRRMDLLASNIANADTPGYKAKDIDFAKVLRGVSGDGDAGSQALTRTDPRQLSVDGGGDGSGDATVYQIPSQPSADGNSVDVQRQQAAYAESALRYQASLSFIDYRLKSLMTAITGN